MTNKYLQKYAYFQQKIVSPPPDSLQMVIVIPARREPDLIGTLKSIKSSVQPRFPYEIIIVFNHPISEATKDKVENERSMLLCREWIRENEYRNIHLIEAFDLPDKQAGVGLARKIGMDEAVRRLAENEKGVIVALDADCTVEKNYLQVLEDHFITNINCNAASIYFEHDLSSVNDELVEGIVQYELHLRYYNQLLKYAGHPFAFHTVGSSMAVRSVVYQKQGGMNKRKAGEDFYFLQKIIQLGNFSEIKTTTVFPSARISDRVPFGTGRAQGEWNNDKKSVLLSYHPQVGEELKLFFHLIEAKGKEANFKLFPLSIQDFIGESKWVEKKDEIVKNTTTHRAFIQRFYSWFNLFMCFKFVHFYRDNYQANISITSAALVLLDKLSIPMKGSENTLELMEKFRELERGL